MTGGGGATGVELKIWTCAGMACVSLPLLGWFYYNPYMLSNERELYETSSSKNYFFTILRWSSFFSESCANIEGVKIERRRAQLKNDKLCSLWLWSRFHHHRHQNHKLPNHSIIMTIYVCVLYRMNIITLGILFRLRHHHRWSSSLYRHYALYFYHCAALCLWGRRLQVTMVTFFYWLYSSVRLCCCWRWAKQTVL